jgi:hypothetical protein
MLTQAARACHRVWDMRKYEKAPPVTIHERAQAVRLAMRKERLRAVQWKAPKPSQSRCRCGATTRSGQPCRAHVVPGRRRCRNHGGLSTGPRTPEGREAIAKSNRRRAHLKS